jgi:hypothetical protein
MDKGRRNQRIQPGAKTQKGTQGKSNWGTTKQATAAVGPPTTNDLVPQPSVNLSHQSQRPSSKPLAYVESGKENNIQVKGGKLRDGLVLLRNVLDIETQRWLAQTCFSVGDGESSSGSGGFYTLKKTTGGGGIFKLNMNTRGRMIDSITSFPEQFSQICVECLKKAQELDPTLPSMSPTTVLINFYKPNASFKWHKDSENPQLIRKGEGKPVISFSIGLSAEFGIKDHYEDEEYLSLRLNSGDVLLFGGHSRMIVHSVLQVYPHTMPAYLRGHMREGRLNITYREVDGHLDETQFPRYRVSYDIETPSQLSTANK